MKKMMIAIVIVTFLFNLNYLYSQDNKTISEDTYSSIGSYYLGFSNDQVTSNPFYYIGAKGQVLLNTKSKINALFDANFMYGTDKYKDIYGWNLATGLRIGSAYRKGAKLVDNISFYVDVYSGISVVKNPITKDADIGINANMSMGFGYKNFGIEYTATKLISDGLNLNSQRITIMYTLPY